MKSAEDIKHAIEQLPDAERESFLAWLRELHDIKYQLTEAPRIYSTQVPLPRMSADEYLAFEQESPVRHEYVGGTLYTRADCSANHNRIVGNLYAALHAHLHGGPCEPFAVNFKLRIEMNGTDIFYYPDVAVACGSGIEEYYLRNPKLVVEVMSGGTVSIDCREKWLFYQRIPALEEYVLIAEDAHAVAVHRRSQGWEPVFLSTPDAVAEFRSVRLSMKIARIYEGVG